jgi:hypothetical protein
MTTVLGITSYLKGEEYLREAKRQGAYVILLTEEKLADAPWPREFIDQVFLMPDLSKLPDVIYAVAYLMRTHKIASPRWTSTTSRWPQSCANTCASTG